MDHEMDVQLIWQALQPVRLIEAAIEKFVSQKDTCLRHCNSLQCFGQRHFAIQPLCSDTGMVHSTPNSWQLC